MPRDSIMTHRERVARRFGARAAGYDNDAQLQRMTARRLAAFIDENGGLPAEGLVAEIGCGTGLLTTLVWAGVERYLATDIAPEMLERCRAKLAALAAAPPAAPAPDAAAVQLIETQENAAPETHFSVLNGEAACFAEPPAAIVTNLAAQWFHDPVAGLVHLAGQTQRLFFAVPLAGSFAEWEQAFAETGHTSGLLPLPDEAALRAGLGGMEERHAVFETEDHRIHYADARAFVQSFKSVGANTPRPGYRPCPIRAVLKSFAGGMDVTVRVLYGGIIKEAV